MLMQLQDISDDEVVPINVEIVDVVSKSAAEKDPFAKLLESPELVKPPRGLSRGSAQADDANQRLLQQLRQGLADFKQNSKDLDEEVEEINIGATFSLALSIAIEDGFTWHPFIEYRTAASRQKAVGSGKLGRTEQVLRCHNLQTLSSTIT